MSVYDMIISRKKHKVNSKKDWFYIKMDNLNYVELPWKQLNARFISIDMIYTLFDHKYPADFYFGGECHSAWEMVYISEGEVGVSADDRVYSLRPGDVIFHQPMEFHKIWSENGSEPRVLIMSFDVSGTYAFRLRKGVFRLWHEPACIMSAIRALPGHPGFLETRTMTDYAAMPNLQVVFSLMEAFLLCLASSEKRLLPCTTGDNVKLYMEIVALLEENVYGQITIQHIADKLHVSTATVKNCFSEYAGCGVHKYFLKIKMRTAIELLEKGALVSEVSEQLGFSNPNYFSLVFKRETGHTAIQHRLNGKR